MPENGLISYWIEGKQRWRFLREIRIGNVDDRSKSVIREIGAEDDRIHARANAEGVDRHIRRAVQGRFHLVDDLFGIDRWRPVAIDHVASERIDGGKGSLDIEHAFDLFMLDHADRSRYTQRDEVILRFRAAQDLYDSTRSLTEGLHSGRPGAIGVRERFAEQTFGAVGVNLDRKSVV